MTADRSDALAAAPQLPPEIWNLAVIFTICVLLGWLARLLSLALSVADLRFAVESRAVLHLKDLGVSLHVLRSASMWHFHQLLRTTTEATSTKMARVHIPFDVVTSSIDLKRSASTGTESELHFKVRANVPCSVQVLWDVQSEALDSLALQSGVVLRTASNEGGASVGSPRQLLSPVLRQLSLDRTVRALRAAPTRLGSRIRRQRRRHELQDDGINVDTAPEDTAPVQSQEPNRPSFTAQSEVVRCEGVQAESQFISVPVPLTAVSSAADDEVQSLMEEIDSHSLSSAAARAPVAHPPVVAAPHFSAVIVLRVSTPPPDRLMGTLFGKLHARQHAADATAVVCQCVALDFLPTPLKSERFTPAVVKKINYTRSAAYTSQEIYGRDATTSNECAICLEGVVSVVLLPCRHFCVCRVCLQEIDRCPICRATFVTYVAYDDVVDGDSDTKDDGSKPYETTLL